jgi:hypothetical protein
MNPRSPGTVRFVRDPMDMEPERAGVRFEKLTAEQRSALRFIRKRPPLFYDECHSHSELGTTA